MKHCPYLKCLNFLLSNFLITCPFLSFIQLWLRYLGFWLWLVFVLLFHALSVFFSFLVLGGCLITVSFYSFVAPFSFFLTSISAKNLIRFLILGVKVFVKICLVFVLFCFFVSFNTFLTPVIVPGTYLTLQICK